MLEPDSKQKDITTKHNSRRLIPHLDVPSVIPCWFHAIDHPIHKSSKLKLSPHWCAFSKRDSDALEKAYQTNDPSAKVPVHEDHLLEVNVNQRTMSPVYWNGPTFKVRRAIWFIQMDGWVPCEENLAEQIELGYYKHKPYVSLDTNPIVSDAIVVENEEISSSKQWNLLGPYLGQYIIYTSKDKAWLLSDSTSSKVTKSIVTRLTNKQNLGGTRLIRGYHALEQLSKSKNEEQEISEDDQLIEEEQVREIDHLVFAVHGVGQKMSERTDQSFIHDVDVLRKTLKSVYPTTRSMKSNGIQVLPIMWRQDIKFGMAADTEGYEADLGIVDIEDGCPTLDELTLDGVPNIRAFASDVLMDIPLYFTQRYRELMTQVISKEINRVYKLFVDRHPDFLKHGKVSIFGHSLGSILAFDVLTLQPDTMKEIDKKLTPLLFPVQNFFAAGSPLGVILLLYGYKIASRKSHHNTHLHSCYPAVDNLYNIFHKSDPVAYRLEPLIARHYSSQLKPVPIPSYHGFKSNVSSGIANRAGAMYESIKMGWTTNLFMRGLGLTRQQIYEDTATRSRSNSDPASAADFAKLLPYSQGAKKLKMLNVTGRVDYCLQDGLLENPYLSALNAHMQYWRDVDMAAFLIKQIYPMDQ